MSTNDFTNALLKKLNETETGAQKNKEGTVIDKNYVHTDNNFTDAEKNKIADLQQENTELSNNMPWNTVAGKSLHITDSAKYSKNRLSLSGDMEQEKRSGKNKFKIPPNGTGYNVTLTKNTDGTFNLNGTATGNASFIAFVDLDKSGIKNNVAYILSSTKNIPTGVDVRVEMFNGTSWLKVLVNSTTMLTATANTTNVTKIRFGIFATSGTTVNIQNLGVQLEEGTVATDYEQYGATPSTEFPSMPVVCSGVQKIRQFGKNLFDVNDKKSVNDLITVDANDWITATYNNSTGTNAKYMNYMTNKCNKIKANTNYALFLEVKNVSGTGEIYLTSEIANEKMQFNNAIAVSFSNLNINKIYKHTITSKTDLTDTAIITMIRSFVKFNAGENGSITFRLSVLEDTNITVNNFVYEPYWEKVHTLNLGTTELCAIKDTNGNVVAKDRAVYRNGKWQWEKIIKKKVLNGTENWYVTGTDTSAVNRFGTNTVFADAQPATSVNVIQPCVCDKLKTVTAGNTYNKVEGISISILHSTAKTTAVYIYTEETENMTIAEFKTWLGANNLTVYYVLATPKYIDCTADQSAILDKIYNNFKLQKGVNNIIVETDNGVGVNLELDYMQDNILKNNYKANEVKTDKKWIDGKDIYRKIVEVTNLSSGNNRIAHNINNFNELIDIRGTGNWNGNWQTIPRLVTDAVNTFGLGLGDINDTKFLIQVGTSYTNFTKAYIIIEYTKTIEVVE